MDPLLFKYCKKWSLPPNAGQVGLVARPHSARRTRWWRDAPDDESAAKHIAAMQRSQWARRRRGTSGSEGTRDDGAASPPSSSMPGPPTLNGSAAGAPRGSAACATAAAAVACWRRMSQKDCWWSVRYDSSAAAMPCTQDAPQRQQIPRQRHQKYLLRRWALQPGLVHPMHTRTASHLRLLQQGHPVCVGSLVHGLRCAALPPLDRSEAALPLHLHGHTG